MLSIFTRFRALPAHQPATAAGDVLTGGLRARVRGDEPAEDDGGQLPADHVVPGAVAGPVDDPAPGDDVSDSPAAAGPEDDDAVGGEGIGDRGRRRRVGAWVITALACALVLFALIAPNRVDRLAPAAVLRIPLEGLLGVALVLVLPARVRRPVAALAGVTLGLLTILKIIDMGFYEVLGRSFDPVLDWILLEYAVEFVTESSGRAGAIGSVVAAAVLAVVLPVLMTLAVLRLTRLVVRHDTTATGAVAVLAAAWFACYGAGVEIVPGLPVASKGAAALAQERALGVRAGLQDKEAFAAEAAVDAFRDTPGDQLLTALRRKDVVLAFVESYGRDAVEDPEFAPQVSTVLGVGDRRLREAGFASRSAFLTSPTFGGNSWLAHATLMSGLWVDNQQRYRTLMTSDRLTLNSAFRRANWRTVGVMPGLSRAWPEGDFYGYDKVYDSRNVGYRGPRFSFARMPDQYTLSAFERNERATSERPPVMAEIPLVSSHVPWAPPPRLVDWDDVGDGSIFEPMAKEGDSPEVVWRSRERVRAEYRRSIEYTLNTLISYVETYGDDDLVLVFLGDHQPSRTITGKGASRDVPITIVARDPAVLDRISGWGWDAGLKPGPQAPVWRMNDFRDRFLTAFGPRAMPAAPSTAP